MNASRAARSVLRTLVLMAGFAGVVAASGVGALLLLALLVSGCCVPGGWFDHDEPATLYTQGGVRMECPHVILPQPDGGYLCGDVYVSKATFRGLNHYGPRSVWW